MTSFVKVWGPHIIHTFFKQQITGLFIRPERIQLSTVWITTANTLELQIGDNPFVLPRLSRSWRIQLDSQLTTTNHVCKVASICFFSTPPSTTSQTSSLIVKSQHSWSLAAFMLSRLDYCNSVLVGLPRS